MQPNAPTDPVKGSQEQYDLLMECVTDYAIFFLDPRGCVVGWNAGAERIFGYAEAEVLGQSFERFFTAEDRASGAPARELEQASATGRAADERWHLRKDGSPMFTSGVTTALRDEGGGLRGFAKVTRDRTERQRADEAVRASEERFRALVENSWEAVSLLGPEGTVLYTSPATVRELGYAAEEFVGQSGFAFIHPDDVERTQQLFGQLLEQPGGKVTTPYRIRHKNGSWRYMEATGTNLLHVPSVAAVVINSRDLTAQREAEDALLAQAELLDLAHVMVRDLDNRILLWTHGMEALYGWKRQEAVGQVSYTLLRTQFPRPMEEIEADLQRHGRWEGELVQTHKDGRRIVVASHWVLHHGWEKQPAAVLVVNNDITAQRRAHEALQEADRQKDEFLAMLAHELRNPLAPIRNAIEVLRLAGTTEANLQWARDVIDRQVGHMSRLVDDLLDISRITRGKVTLSKERIDLATVLGRAVETSRPLFDVRGHQLTVNLPPGAVRLEADPLRLAQVVSNLLNNAAKYTRPGGQVVLTAGPEGHQVVIRVKDTGVGIAPELLPHVFDLFVQGDRSLARSEGGLGIGLTLVKRLVEMHGGSVEVFSAGPGQGSEFTVRLPARDETTASPAGGAAAPGAASCRQILVVDDSVDATESLAMLLRTLGHEVRTAHDGSAALEVAATFRPDVVLLDIGLPGMSGYEVARQLRQLPGWEDVFLAALTGYGQEEDRRQALEAGFDAHLIKPTSLDALEQLLVQMPVE